MAPSDVPTLMLGSWMDDISFQNFSKTEDWGNYCKNLDNDNYQCAKACPYASMYLWAIICLQKNMMCPKLLNQC